jgi:signal peptidase
MRKIEHNMKSPLWYLLPAFLGITGGLIAYLILKNNDSKKAKNALLIGIIVSIPFFVLIGMSTILGVEMLTMEGNQIQIGGPFYVVATQGMEPVLQVYDIIVIQGHDPFEEVEIGDMIVFDSPSENNRVIISRVVSIINENPKTVRAQGDAILNSWILNEKEYIGKVEKIIPQVGYVTQILQPPTIYIIFVVVIGIMIIKHLKFKKMVNSAVPASTEVPASTAESAKELEGNNITDMDKQIAINEEKIRKIEEESKKLDEDD